MKDIIAPEQIISGQILVKTLAAIKAAAVAGATTKDLDILAQRMILAAGAEPTFLDYEGFPASICASPNDLVAHGIPDNEPISAGDLLSIDLGVTYQGWITDAAVTLGIGWVGSSARRVYHAATRALLAGTKAARVGNTTGDIGAAIEAVARTYDCGITYELGGHGVGRDLHQEPSVPNWGLPGEGAVLQEGMTICIEPMFTSGGDETFYGPDGEALYTADGSLAAHVEWTICCLKEGPYILTPWHRQTGISL